VLLATALIACWLPVPCGPRRSRYSATLRVKLLPVFSGSKAYCFLAAGIHISILSSTKYPQD
jgi:hypothetical protein